MIEKDKYYTYEQVAEILQTTRQTIHRWVQEEKLIRYKIGRLNRVKGENLLHALDEKDKGFNENEIYRPEDVAERLKVSPSTVYRWMQGGAMPSITLCSTKRIRGSDLIKILERGVSLDDGKK